MFKTSRFQIVEVNCSSASVLRHPLPVNQVLETARKITAIQAWPAEYMNTSPVSGKVVFESSALKRSFLNIVSKEGNEEILSQLPLSGLVRETNDGVFFEVCLPPINITKCYISVPDTSPLNTNNVWVLGFHYEN